MNRNEAVDFLVNRPVELAHKLGFTKLTDLHNRWIKDMVCGSGDKTLQGARGTYKTTCVSIALAEIIILLPNYRTLFMRKTVDDVKEVIAQVSKILQEQHVRYLAQVIWNVDLQLLKDTAYEISTNLISDTRGTSQLVGVGSGTSITGSHYEKIFTDDIVTLADRKSKADREATKLAYQELQNVKNKGKHCRIFNTGTPWHEDDCFTLMPKAEKYDIYRPEIRELFTAEEIESRRKSLSPSLFAANYELRHIPSDQVMFLNPQTGADDSMVKDGIMQLDSAYYGDDFTAWTIAKEHDGKLYVYGKMRRKHVEDCYDGIIDDYSKFLARKVLTETNADKGYVARDLRLKGLRVQTYAERENKYIKISTYLKGKWSDVIFTEGTDDEYIKQVTDFYEDADHDDAPDSLASLVRYLYQYPKTEYEPLWNN